MWPFSSKARKSKEIKALFDATPLKAGLFSDPVTVDFSILGSCDMTGYFAYGIFNPMGPTISIVSLLRHETDDRSLIHFLMLNPFAQESVAIGVLLGKPDEKQLMETITEAFAINDFSDLALVGGLPTFLLHGGSKESLELGNACLSRHVSENDRTGEVAEQLSSLREFEGRPWDRASRDMDQAMNAILAKATGKPISHAPSPESVGGGNATSAWLAHLISASHLKLELAGFLQAWEGSIGNQKGSQLARSAMPLQEMIVCAAHCNPEFMTQMRGAIG